MQTHHDLPVPAVSEGELVAEGYDLDALLNQHFRGRVAVSYTHLTLPTTERV